MTTVHTWLRERRRRDGPDVKAVYPSRNVVSLSGWRWAKAAKDSERAENELKLARVNYRAAEARFLSTHGPLIELVAAEVLRRLEHAKAAKPRRRSGKAKSKSKLRVH